MAFMEPGARPYTRERENLGTPGLRFTVLSALRGVLNERIRYNLAMASQWSEHKLLLIIHVYIIVSLHELPYSHKFGPQPN